MSMPIRARIALMTMLVLAASLQAADWPTFRKDNARSGITDETLSLPLTASWVFSQRFVPEPAFGLGYPFGTNWEGGVEKRRIDFDRADSAVIAGGKVYFGSVGDGKVYCVDAATGKVVWTFLTGGPVRLAPSVVGGKVYFGSDDGYVYCIGAADGKEVWRLRAAPADHHVVGNGSLVSLWPVRTGVVVDGGIAYFGTGIFAAEGVFIYAVDAATGKVLWRNDQGCEERMGQICPMGYPLVTASRLVIPMSRLAPAVYDRKTGSKLTRLSIYYGGGTFGTMYRSLLFTGWESAHCFDVDKDLAIQGGTSQSVASFPGGQLVATGKAVYSCGLPRAGGVSNAVQAYTWEIPDKIPGQTDIKRGQAKPLGKPAKWWSAKVAEPEAIILAGKHLIVGRPGEVLALGTEDGKTVWSANVDGVAKSLAVADGRLYVSTDTGKLYCFAAAGTKKIGHVAQGIDAPTISPAIKAAADTIVKNAPHAKKGFALVYGVETGELAVELARRTEMKIYAVSPDAEKVAAARKLAEGAGLYGGRIVVQQWPLEKVPYTKYFAGLIVSETAIVTGRPAGSAAEIYRMTKPIRGTVVLGRPGGNADAMMSFIANSPLSGAKLTDDGGLAVYTRPPLKGAKHWTHQYAGPGGTGSSEDDLVRAPLRVQWFGNPGAERFVDRHYWAAAPLAMDGRMFVCSYDDVRAYDVYNGTELWKYPLKNATRPHMADVPSNVAVCEEGYFVAVDDICYRIDPATGEKIASYKVPTPADGSRRMWGYVGITDGVLVGTRTLGHMDVRKWPKSGKNAALWLLSDMMFGIDIATGKVLWTYKETDWFRHNVMVLGPGTVFVSHNGQTTKEAIAATIAATAAEVKTWAKREQKAVGKALATPHLELLAAVDVRTGKPRWKTLVDWTLCGGGRGTLIYKDGRLLQMSDVGGCKAFGGYAIEGNFGRAVTLRDATSGKRLWTKPLNYRSRAVIIEDTIIAEPWAYDLQTGKKKMVPHPVTGKPTPWVFVRPLKHCGPFNASKHMLFFRNGGFGYIDIGRNEGVSRFESNRPNCWTSYISAEGVALWPTSDSGCRCGLSMQCTVALVHDDQSRVFNDFTTSGPLTPVKHLSLNLGAPGDRRDDDGQLWLAFPRHGYSGMLKLPVKTEYYEGGAPASRSAMWATVAGTQRPWVFTSRAAGLKKLTVPVQDAGAKPAAFEVALSFAAHAADKPGQRVFDVKIQGKVVCKKLDIVKQAHAAEKALVLTFKDITAAEALTIELVAAVDTPSKSNWPVLSGVTITRK